MDIEYTKDNPLRCFFAFEGYNSQGLALNRLKQHYPDFDWVCVGRSEIDKYAIQAADALFPEAKDKNYGDISNIDWNKVPDFDLFTMSSPCQDFSSAGLQKGGAEGSGTRSSLLWECRRAILVKKPKYIVFENVKALVSQKFMPYFLKWQNELASYGYTNFAKVLDSQHYGVPQHRERVFMVSILDENASFHFPEPFPLERKLKDVLEKEVDEKYYLSEKCINGFLAHAERHKNDRFKFNPTNVDVVANTILASSQCRPCDNFIKTVGNLYGDNKQAGRIYDAEGIAPTLDNMASGGNKSPKIVEPQVLTPKRNEYGKAVRKDYENGKLDESHHNMTDLQPREDGVSNTITSVQKDNLLFEPKQVIGSSQRCAYRGDVDGIAPTITAACGMGGGQTPMILGVTVNPNRKFEFNNGHIRQDTCHTLTAQDAKNTSVVWEQGFRIRKLTPREVFRLMDVDDADIDKIQAAGISRSQQYKLAGNSIVTNVLFHIFRELFVDKENENQQLTLF